MGKGKRDHRRAHRAWCLDWLENPTDPDTCDCTHAGLPPVWHHSTCAIKVDAMATKP